MITGLQNAEFIKYGVMHRNKYINSSKLLDNTYNLKSNNNIYFAGQITGVEGYVESISSGMVAALNALNRFANAMKLNQIKNKAISEKDKVNVINPKENKVISFSENTVIGALAKYISTPNEKFQPMNANFGILPELEERKIKDKKERYQKLAERSLNEF